MQIARLSDGTRKVITISEVTAMEDEIIAMQDIFSFDRLGWTKAARCEAYSAPPESVRNLPSAWRLAAVAFGQHCLNRGWRLAEEVLMPALIALLIFIVVSHRAASLSFSLLDERKSRARVLRDRLASTKRPAESQAAAKNIALLRDEMLSEIPALDSLLRRSARVSALQKMLSQADIKIRAGNFLICAWVSAVLAAFSSTPSPTKSDFRMGQVFCWAVIIPYSFATYRRGKRFGEFEELFPEAIDTLARAVRAGHAFTTALEMISNEVSEPVAGEFRKLFEEQKFGLPVREALHAISSTAFRWWTSNFS